MYLQPANVSNLIIQDIMDHTENSFPKIVAGAEMPKQMRKSIGRKTTCVMEISKSQNSRMEELVRSIKVFHAGRPTTTLV